MKQIYLGLILICTFVFVGCSEKIGDKFYPSENYVTRYQDPLSSYAAVYGSIDEYPVCGAVYDQSASNGKYGE